MRNRHGEAVFCCGKTNHFVPMRSDDWNGWRSMGILFASVTGYEPAISNVVETADVARGEPTCKGTLRVGDTGYWSIRCCEMGEMCDIVIRDVKSDSKVVLDIPHFLRH